MNKMKQEILFYKRAYEDSSQNALWRYMLEYFARRYTELVKEKLGTDILDTQLAYSIRFYCMGSVGMTREWVLTDNITLGGNRRADDVHFHAGESPADLLLRYITPYGTLISPPIRGFLYRISLAFSASRVL